MGVTSRTPLPFPRRWRAPAHAEPAPSWWLTNWPHLVDACLAAAVGLAVLLVYDVPYMLSYPFWFDEASDVAITVRAPIGLTHSLALQTPVVWTYLLRLVPPVGGPERLRVVPLVFTMLAAAAGYLLGRELRLNRFITGILTGTAVLLAPTLLIQYELKQYTAEAFACLVVWILVARAENEWRFRRLAAIAAVASVGLLFSNTVIFVGVAAMVGLGLECLVGRRWRRLAEVGAASAGLAIVSLAIYLTILRPQVSPLILTAWGPTMIPTTSWHAAVTFVHQSLVSLAPYAGFRSLIADAIGALAGVVALIWLRRIALAVIFPLTMVIVIAASAAHKYPFSVERTSTFWLVMVPLLMSIAVASAVRLAGKLDRRAPALAAVVALALWVPAMNGWVRSHPFPPDDVRSQVYYLDHHFRPGDVVLVTYDASWGFAYYYPPKPSFPAGGGLSGHVVAYPSRPWIIIQPVHQQPEPGLAAARAKIAAEPAATRGRIWIIRTRLQRYFSAKVWQQLLAGQPVQVIKVGNEPILLYKYQPPGPTTAPHR